MNAILLIVIILGSSFQNAVQKRYLKKTNGRGIFVYGAMASTVAAVFFACTAGGILHMEQTVLPYSVGFAVSYATANVFFNLAIRHGSLALSSLMLSYSMIIPTFYGLIFLKESSGKWFYVGLILLGISFVFINLKKGEMQITPQWALCALFAFVGNGMCTTVIKMQQVKFGGAYKSEFMIVGLCIVAISLLLIALVSERAVMTNAVKVGLPWVLSAGLANGMVNLFIIILSGNMATSLMFPLISAGGIVFTTGISYFIFREKLSVSQSIGLVFGIISVIFLNI